MSKQHSGGRPRRERPALSGLGPLSPVGAVLLVLGVLMLALMVSGCGGQAPEEGGAEAEHEVVDADHTPPDGVRVVDIEVVIKDGSITVDFPRVAVGWTRMHIKNEGTQPHAFEVLEDGKRIDQLDEEIAPGSAAELTLLLSPGEYELACRLPNSAAPGETSTHYSKGEHADLKAD